MSEKGSDNSDAPAFSDVILQFRKEHLGLSQSEFAERLNVSTQTIYRWEKGSTKPQKSQLIEIAKLAKKEGADDILRSLAESAPTKNTKSVLSQAIGAALGLGALGLGLSALTEDATEQADDEEGRRSRSYVKTVDTMLRNAADELGVSENEFAEALRPALQIAADQDWPARWLLEIVDSAGTDSTH